MKPISQTTQYDCYRACIASILNLPIDCIPCPKSEDVNCELLWRQYEDVTLTKAMASFNVELFTVSTTPTSRPPVGYCIASCWHSEADYNDKNKGHAVVHFNGKEVWDPLTNTKFGAKPIEDKVFTPIYTIILPIDPSKPIGLEFADRMDRPRCACVQVCVCEGSAGEW